MTERTTLVTEVTGRDANSHTIATTNCRCGHPTGGHSPAGAGDACTCIYPADTCEACDDVAGKTDCLPDYGHCICAVYRCRSCGSTDIDHVHGR